MKRLIAFDFGLSQTKVAIRIDGSERLHVTPSSGVVDENLVSGLLHSLGHQASDFDRIAVTGGKHARLPDHFNRTPLLHFSESQCTGFGGADLAHVTSAMVVSAGTGTACISVRDGVCKHTFGTAVGGGTLQGLGRLLLGQGNAERIDELARTGVASACDLTIVDAIGGQLDYLPSDMTAVNFGRVAIGASPTQADLAAGLTNMVAQTVSLIAIGAARAENQQKIIFVGSLLQLPRLRAYCHDVASIYGVTFDVPGNGTFAGALGALELIA